MRDAHRTPAPMGFICFLRRFRRDNKGVAAVEFALLLPVLLLLFTGFVEVTNYMMVSRKVIAATQSAGDLVGVEITVDSTAMDNIFNAATSIMFPFDTNNFSIAVASVRYDIDTGAAAEDWQDGSNGGVINGSAALGAGFGVGGESVLIARSVYNYQPLVSAVFPLNLTITETSFIRPRRVPFIAFN